MLYLITYKRSKTTFLAKPTKNPQEFVLLRCVSNPSGCTPVKAGNLVSRKAAYDKRTYIPLDTEEKIGEYLLLYEL
ncbi:MAG: hypothetical protein PHW03_09000 [Eubacteriales bacterium]|nr:hypothetical protein [Eubacteriales bacterium]